MRPFVILAVVVVDGVSSTFVATIASFFSSAGASVVSGTRPPLVTMAETSVPVGPIMVSKLSTGAVSPSCTPMYRMVPS